MRVHLLASAATLVLLAGCGVGAPDYPDFEATSYRIEGMTTPPDGTAQTRTVIYRDGPKMRVEAALPGYGQATIVFDESTNSAYVLNPVQSPMALPTAAPGATPAPTSPQGAQAAPGPVAAPPTAAAPAQPAAAAGLAVRVPDADAPQPLESAWSALGEDNAVHVGACQAAGENGHEWRAANADASGAARIACITNDGIVLRIRENEQTLWQATALERGDQDPALFGVPPGYRLFDPQAVTQQVGETMENLDSVTGEQPPPASP